MLIERICKISIGMSNVKVQLALFLLLGKNEKEVKTELTESKKSKKKNKQTKKAR